MTEPADVAKDRAAGEAFIARDFHFTSPLDNRIDRAVYFARCWPNSEYTVRFTFMRPLVTLGDRVVATYESTTTAGKRFRNTEILTVRDGQLIEAEVYFGWNIPHEASVGRFIDK